MQLIRLLKDWTLPVAISTGCVVYMIFALVPALDGFATAAEPVFDAILPMFMFLILFVTFCKVDFHRMRPVTWHWWVGVFQVLCVGAVMAAVLAFRLNGNLLILAEALLTCIISPCASAAPVVTQKLGGNPEEMTTYTFLSNFITALLIPVCFPLLDSSREIHFFAAFALILYKVFTVLVVPMLLAYVVKHHMKHLCQRIVSVKDLSYYLWGCSLLIVSGTTMKNIFNADTTLTFLLIIAVGSLLLCIFQFACGRAIGGRFGETVNAGQGLGQKNTAFAIWIACTYLSPLSAVGPGCYILWQNIINSVEIWQAQKKKIT